MIICLLGKVSPSVQQLHACMMSSEKASEPTPLKCVEEMLTPSSSHTPHLDKDVLFFPVQGNNY